MKCHVLQSRMLLAAVMVVGLVIAGPACRSTAPVRTVEPKPGFWGAFPADANPKVLGTRVVNNLLNGTTIASRDYGVIYPEVCVSFGSLRFAGQVGDRRMVDKLVKRYEGMLRSQPLPGAAPPVTQPAEPAPATQAASTTRAASDDELAAAPTTAPQGRGRGGRGGRRGRRGGGIRGITPAGGTAARMIPAADHVDRSVFGILPLEIFRQTSIEAFRPIGKKSADAQWAYPIEGGLTDQTRWWIDDMYMITSLQAEAYRVLHDKVYIDRAATQMAAYLDALQQPNGLFHHADDAPFLWGRGNGWVAAGLAELLMELPKDHPLHPRIMDGYKKMMAALLKYQAPDGMWRQLIDDDQSWDESSGTGMFIFAMGMGVKQGWLDAAAYKEPARRAWTGLAKYLDEQGRVHDVCIGTNKGYTVQYYLERERIVGDLHGQAAFIWAAWAMLD